MTREKTICIHNCNTCTFISACADEGSTKETFEKNIEMWSQLKQ